MSSKRRLRRRACEGKRIYRTHWDALTARNYMRDLGLDPYKRLQVYKCKFHPHYHVGHVKIKNKRRF